MLQKIEYNYTKKINDDIVILKVKLINIRVGDVDYWNCMASVHMFSAAGEEITIKCVA
ncbi:MAG: hypothetical protein V1900_03590 [Candidatus Aenigmatarchaeota archaeon]